MGENVVYTAIDEEMGNSWRSISPEGNSHGLLFLVRGGTPKSLLLLASRDLFMPEKQRHIYINSTHTYSTHTRDCYRVVNTQYSDREFAIRTQGWQ